MGVNFTTKIALVRCLAGATFTALDIGVDMALVKEYYEYTKVWIAFGDKLYSNVRNYICIAIYLV